MKLSPRYIVKYKQRYFKQYYNMLSVFHYCNSHFRDNVSEEGLLNSGAKAA